MKDLIGIRYKKDAILTDTEKVFLTNPSTGFVTQEDANHYFHDEIEKLNDGPDCGEY